MYCTYRFPTVTVSPTPRPLFLIVDSSIRCFSKSKRLFSDLPDLAFRYVCGRALSPVHRLLSPRTLIPCVSVHPIPKHNILPMASVGREEGMRALSKPWTGWPRAGAPVTEDRTPWSVARLPDAPWLGRASKVDLQLDAHSFHCEFLSCVSIEDIW
ncbi:hypothetical protein LZ32DRAFT_264465 [Colletotrichum eremochloae]|nr:hypothetical protein LZ32DRAFT_264465 [Colletotrichum eremochloae]